MSNIKEIHLKDYKESPFIIESVHLTFELFDEYTLVKSIMQITKVQDDIKNLELDSIDLELKMLVIDNNLITQEKYVYED